MAKTSATPPPATHGTVLEAPKSDTPGDTPDNKLQFDVTATDTAFQKRGPGRPPKVKSDSPRNGAVSAKPSRKPSGRLKRNLAPAVPTASAAAAAVKSTRGRPKRSNPPPVTASQVTTTVDGSRKRGRPKKDDMATATVPATVAPAKKRGRKPNVEVVAAKPVRRTRKSTHGQKDSSVAPVAANLGDLKKKTALLQKKVKEAAAKLKIAITAIDEVQVIAAGM